MATHIGDTDIIFGDSRQPKALPLSHPKARWGEFGRETKVLPKGYIRRRGCLPLPCDILFDRDIPIKLRDGTTVYIDIYRPPGDVQKCPALLAWSPYGKQGGRGNQVLDDFPFRMGVPLSKLSELQKWEAPDPGYWVQYGYAVANVDPRGVGKSEGDIYQFGSQEGRDGADVVDWIGEQPWCSGKVSLSGNSYLSISQWYIAAENPKHLAAIAPWEGFSDLYREGIALGGVLNEPAMNFNLQILQVNAGENSWENTAAMAMDHKYFGAYHDDKRAKVENINVPAYVVASWSNPIHTFGTFCAYTKLKSPKWLRVHDTWEWPDYYDEENRSDLHRFFDHYLKGIDNGWDHTPKIRAKILDTAKPLPKTGVDRKFTSFPPQEAVPFKLFLDSSDNSLSPAYPKTCQGTYTADKGGLSFSYTFPKAAVLCGVIDMSLAISLDGASDTDVFITFEKVTKTGAVGKQLKIPYEKSYQSYLIRAANYSGLVPDTDVLFYKGPVGQMRLSRRMLEKEHAVPGFKASDMKQYNPVQGDEIVILQPPLTPIGMEFSAGEALRVHISGTNTEVFPPIDQATLTVQGLEDLNKEGAVTIHCGLNSEGDSYITLPILSGN